MLYTAANDTLKIWNMAKGGLNHHGKVSKIFCWTSNGLLGVASGVNYLSVWEFDEKQKVGLKMNKKVSEKK